MMLENRRYTRYDVTNEKIEVQIYDVNGFSFLGHIQNISRGGLQFTTKTPIRWKDDEIMTLYVFLPNEKRVTALDVRPVRSKRKLFEAAYAGEFVGNVMVNEAIAPLLDWKEKQELALA